MKAACTAARTLAMYSGEGPTGPAGGGGGGGAGGAGAATGAAACTGGVAATSLGALLTGNGGAGTGAAAGATAGRGARCTGWGVGTGGGGLLTGGVGGVGGAWGVGAGAASICRGSTRSGGSAGCRFSQTSRPATAAASSVSAAPNDCQSGVAAGTAGRGGSVMAAGRLLMAARCGRPGRSGWHRPVARRRWRPSIAAG